MRRTLCTAGGLALLLVGASGASATGVTGMARSIPEHMPNTLIHSVHSLHEAKHTLYGLGYYDVRVERATLPFSFTGCKRGVRYHIHVDYYGDLVQVDELGACRGYGNDDDDYSYRNRSYRNRRYSY